MALLALSHPMNRSIYMQDCGTFIVLVIEIMQDYGIPTELATDQPLS